MKNMLVIITILLVTLIFTDAAWSRTILVSGTGHESGSCMYTQPFCINDLQNRAERSGQDQARWTCQAQQGNPLTYTAHCSSSCFPSVVGPGQTTWVSCDANCSMQCEVE